MDKNVVKLAFAGRKFSGKDEFADMAEELYSFYTFSFSDQLKMIATQLFPFMKIDYPSEEKETLVVYHNRETGVSYTPRMLWQNLDILPEIYPEIFVDMLNEEFNRFCKTCAGVGVGNNIRALIKDVRRPAELNYVRKMGFYLVYIESDNPRSFNKYSQHKSESYQDLIRETSDKIIFNKRQENWKEFISEEVKCIAQEIGIEKRTENE